MHLFRQRSRTQEKSKDDTSTSKKRIEMDSAAKFKDSTHKSPSKHPHHRKSFPHSIFRTILTWTVITLLTPIICGLGSLAIILRPFVGIAIQQRISFYFMGTWMRIVLSCSGLPYTVKGLERLNPNKRYIFVRRVNRGIIAASVPFKRLTGTSHHRNNHQSHMDACLVGCSIPWHFVGMAKQSLSYIPFLGWNMWAEGTIFVNRRNHTRAVDACQRLANDLIESTTKHLWICPEGTRTRDGKLQEFKKGGMILAVQTGLPVVPMAVCGSYDVLQKGSRCIHPRPIKLVIGDPIPTAGVTFDQRDSFTKQVRDAVQALLAEHDSIDGAAPDDNYRVESFFHCFVPLPKSSDKAYHRRTLALPPEDAPQPPTSGGEHAASQCN